MESDKITFFPLNLDAMLKACVPGGSSCDPQKVSDAIREWFSVQTSANESKSHDFVELNNAICRAFPDDQVSAIKAQSTVLPIMRHMAERLALMDKHSAINNKVIQMLVACGYITNDIASQAFKIAHGFEDGPLKTATNRSWWKDVKPETDLTEANDVIACMLEDWQKVGEALGFKDFEDSEIIIAMCKKLFEESSRSDTAEAFALLDGVIAKLERDDEYGLEPDLRSLRRLMTAGCPGSKPETPVEDDFADIREFRRREAEMNRLDADRAAAKHDELLRAQFPREAAARDKARAAPTESQFDAMPISAGSAPEAPAPMAAEITWKRDDEKTMLRILLLSEETTGFHGNDPAVHIAKIAKWTDDECRAVDDWCVAMHLHAGDRGVSIPPKPVVIAPSSFSDENRPQSICGRITKLIAAETRYPEHHFTQVAMTIAQMFNHVDEDALAILDGIAFKLEHGNTSDVGLDLIALRTRLTKNKRLHS